jgi:glycosyltransferase involved in cell wall biosynthesis
LRLTLGVFLSQFAAVRAAAIVAVSENIRRELWRSADRLRAKVIPCGVNFARIGSQDRLVARRQLGLPLDRRLVLFVDPERPIKDFALARRSLELLRALRDDVELVTMSNVPRQRVPAYLHAVDLLLLTSRSEGSPVITKEALAANLGVVAVDVGDVREQLEGVSGCCVTSNRPEEIAAAMDRILRGDVGAREGIARHHHHAIEHTCTRLLDLYKHVLQ